jgi:hypothetical protein
MRSKWESPKVTTAKKVSDTNGLIRDIFGYASQPTIKKNWKCPIPALLIFMRKRGPRMKIVNSHNQTELHAHNTSKHRNAKILIGKKNWNKNCMFYLNHMAVESQCSRHVVNKEWQKAKNSMAQLEPSSE